MPQTVTFCIRPIGAFRPLVRDCDGNIIELPEGEALQIGGAPVYPLNALGTNAEIYLSTGGDDDTGDGSPTGPFASIYRAAEHYGRFIPGDHNIRINVEAGIYDCPETFDVAYPYGAKLHWEGEAETFSNPAISNIAASAATDGDFPELEYVDFDIELTGADATEGYFVRLWSCANGTNPDGLNGTHEIVAWDAMNEIATCRVWRRLNTTELPSGSITVATAYLIKSVLHFTSDNHGFDIRGPFSFGTFDKIVVKGNPDAYASQKRAVRLFNGADIRMDGGFLPISGGFFTGLSISEWGAGVELVGGSTFYSLRCGVAKIRDNAFTIGTHSRVLAAGGVPSLINGVNLRALWAHGESAIVATAIQMQSNGSPVVSEQGAFIDVRNARIHYDQGSGIAIFADDLGRVLETGATIVGFATDYSPTADTFGNNGSYIGTL